MIWGELSKPLLLNEDDTTRTEMKPVTLSKFWPQTGIKNRLNGIVMVMLIITGVTT